MDLRSRQAPLKQQYREDGDRAKITLTATGSNVADGPIACSIDIGRAIYEAQAHAGVGGEGTGPCSGDLLLGALAACKQITVQMVAAAMGLDVDGIQVTVDGDVDLKGTLGIDRNAPVGFTDIRVKVVVSGGLTGDELASLERKSERYCVVLQTLLDPPPVSLAWRRAEST